MAIGLQNREHQLLMEYPDIPNVITVSSYTTELEQLRLSSENFHQIMIEKILPAVIDPKINVKELYEIDYYLILRHLRLMTWGPMFTIGSYYCENCLDENNSKGKLWVEKHTVRLDTVRVLLPDEGEKIPTSVEVTPEDFVFTDATVKLGLTKCSDLLLIEKTKAKLSEGKKSLLPMAAAVREVTGIDFVDITEAVNWLAALPAADFMVLRECYNENFGYGLSTRGEIKCEHCGKEGWFYAPVNDYYFRPDRENIKEWIKLLRTSGKSKSSGR